MIAIAAIKKEIMLSANSSVRPRDRLSVEE
jgi:hypothetical protein